VPTGGGANPLFTPNRSPQHWTREHVGGNTSAPYPTRVATVAPVFSQTWQVGAVFSGKVAGTIPGGSLGGYNLVTLYVPLSSTSQTQPSFPNSITLTANQQAIIVPTVSSILGVAAFNTVMPGLPQVSPYFGAGGGGTASAPGTITSYSGPVTLTGPALKITVPFYYAANLGAASPFTLNVQALLIGVQL